MQPHKKTGAAQKSNAGLLLGLFNLTEEDKITEAIKRLALSDEFTLYCDIALSNLKDINNYNLVKVQE